MGRRINILIFGEKKALFYFGKYGNYYIFLKKEKSIWEEEVTD